MSAVVILRLCLCLLLFLDPQTFLSLRNSSTGGDGDSLFLIPSRLRLLRPILLLRLTYDVVYPSMSRP